MTKLIDKSPKAKKISEKEVARLLGAEALNIKMSQGPIPGLVLHHIPKHSSLTEIAKTIGIRTEYNALHQINYNNITYNLEILSDPKYLKLEEIKK